MEYNKYQTPITKEVLESLPDEIRDQFEDYILNIPYINYLVSPDRKYAKDLPRDKEGRIIVDLAHPHILENMDYFRESALHYKKYGVYTFLRPNANPNSDYGKWLRRERDRCWYGMVRPEDGEWITGDMYFYLNYNPIIQTKIKEGAKFGERVVDFPEVWDGVYLAFHYIDQARNGGLYNNFEGGENAAEIAKRGAAHPYDEYVYTPDGKRLWGDIKVGDKLFGPKNNIVTVSNIPFDDVCDIYELTLKDGRKVRASNNHLWEIDFHGRKDVQLLTTEELLQQYKRKRKVTDRNPNGIEYVCSIHKNDGVEWQESKTMVDPYTFGLLLGDGCFRHQCCYYTCQDSDFEKIKNFIPYQYTKWESGKYAYRLHIDNWKNILKEYGLDGKKSEDKFIPDEYKYNSRKVRLELLKGLIDSDGFLGKHNVYMISISSKQLCDDICFLCRSLGFNCNYTIHKAGYQKDGVYIKCLDSYHINIYTDQNIAKLSRKITKDKFHNNYSRSHIERTRIVDIRYIGKQNAKCVTVDSLDGLYLINDFIITHNSKSYVCASKAAKYFILGESRESCQRVKSLLSAYQKEYLTKDGTLNKFIDTINFCAENTQFPSLRTKDSLQEMTWKMGYKDKDTGIEKGSKNEVLGVSAKDDPDKMRGKRVNLMIYEEFGNWPKFLDTYRVCLPNVKEGDTAFGLAFAIGTGGSEGADFMGAYELIYNPLGYDVYAIPNVYDKGSNGEQKTIYFFPAYLNYKGLYDHNGNSDITGALLKLLQTRYKVKYNSSDPMALTRTKAENPITIQDAIMKRDSTIYPVAEINDRIQYLLSHRSEVDSSWTGTLSIENGKIIYKPDNGHKVIRFFPHKDNKLEGAVEIFAMPELDKDGKPQNNRYIAGIDPYDDDASNTMSLGSLFILDLFTDKIVLEYTGRPKFAEDFYELCRRCLLFYDARCNYENNKKGLFTYFSKMNCLYLLTETLDFLKDKDPTKANYYGNKARGTIATEPIKAYGRRCIRDWLLKPMPIITNSEEGKENEEETYVPQLDAIKSIPLLKELAMWNSQDNFDRHDALAMLMLLREDKLRLLGVESPSEAAARADKNYLGDDEFFEKNFRKYGGDLDPRIAKLFGIEIKEGNQI